MEHEILTLIKGCQQQEPLAQKQLYQHCYGAMYKVVQRYIADTEKVSIVLNDAMLKVFKNLDKYQPTAPFMAWVKQIVVNTCIDYVRIKANMRSTDAITDITINDYSIEPTILEKLDGTAILHIINQLPTKLATVFNLYIYEEYSHNEIAETLQIPVGTSRYYLSEAKQQLKQIIENNIYSLNKTTAQ